MWVLIDNYDSFTYILRHYLLQTGHECVVVRNDELSPEELRELAPSRIIISPGPETPAEAGICMEVIHQFHRSVPILGVCLGHQALGVYFGARLVRAAYPMHGKTSPVNHNGQALFSGISSPFPVMRYHSLAIEGLEGTGLEALAWSADDQVLMAMVHRQFPCVGIQFHPESVGTEQGLRLLQNWAAFDYSHFQ